MYGVARNGNATPSFKQRDISAMQARAHHRYLYFPLYLIFNYSIPINPAKTLSRKLINQFSDILIWHFIHIKIPATRPPDYNRTAVAMPIE
jgi:hypothetical protein